jgi:hypothetical protein
MPQFYNNNTDELAEQYSSKIFAQAHQYDFNFSVNLPDTDVIMLKVSTFAYHVLKYLAHSVPQFYFKSKSLIKIKGALNANG